MLLMSYRALQNTEPGWESFRAEFELKQSFANPFLFLRVYYLLVPLKKVPINEPASILVIQCADFILLHHPRSCNVL